MLGTRSIAGTTIDLFCGDITEFVCDCMVNAANSQLSGGGGVDGAIHKAGGPSILKECQEIGSCPTGEAVLTNAGNLPCKFIIHTVGPVWDGGHHHEEGLLKKAYSNSLKLASEKPIRHLAFSAISCGIYRFPLPKAASIAISTTIETLTSTPHPHLKRITFVLFNRDIYNIFQSALLQQLPESKS